MPPGDEKRNCEKRNFGFSKLLTLSDLMNELSKKNSWLSNVTPNHYNSLHGCTDFYVNQTLNFRQLGAVKKLKIALYFACGDC